MANLLGIPEQTKNIRATSASLNYVNGISALRQQGVGILAQRRQNLEKHGLAPLVQREALNLHRP
jgi:hypothetical protein